MTDHDLLQAYARHDASAQAAFAELVARHLNLVYSAARRQIRSTAHAEDIAQSVFLDLARHASTFPSDQPLAPWLHVVTRRTALDTIRRESRRTAREYAAAQLAATDAMPSPSPSSTWSQLEPHLDEAVAALPAPDRHAILLRYFENKSLREIGAALGTTDDAAQKRVSRALDQLRTLLLRRGLTVTAAGLASELSAHAILTAPSALTGAISVAVAHASLTAAAPAAGLAVMTTLQKSLAVTALIGTTGACLFQAAVYARQESALADLRARTSALQRQIAATENEHALLAQRLAATDAAIDTRLSQARQVVAARDDAALDATLTAWIARARRLKSFAAARPDLSIPEFRLLTDDHWAEIAAKSAPDSTGDSDATLQKALAAARQKAESLFAPQLQTALAAFLRTSDNELPASLYQLLPHFASPIVPDLFSRYRLTHSGKLSAVPDRQRGTFLIEINPARVVDPNTDNIVSIGLYGTASHGAKNFAHTREVINRRAQAAPVP